MRPMLNPHKPRRAEHRGRAVAAPFAFAVLSLVAVRVSARPADTQTQTTPEAAAVTPAAASSQPSEEPNAAVNVKDVAWSEAVDGLQPGFLLRRTGLADAARVPLNSWLGYTVLVRNTTERERVFEVRLGGTDPWGPAPYVIPGDQIGAALRAPALPERFRAQGPTALPLAVAAYLVRLAPGEAVVVPGSTGVYVGDADPSRYPRRETVQAGTNWIVQPITVRVLNAAETTQFEATLKTPYSSKKTVTIVGRDGKNRPATAALTGAQAGGKQLYARIPLEIAPPDTK